MKIEKLRNPYVSGNEGCSVSMIDLLEKINEIVDAMNGEHEPADIYSEDGRLIAKKDESDDERIRKWLADYFGSIKKTVWIHRDITCEQILAWLEKQKEPTKEELYAEAGTTENEYIANTMKMVRAMREKQKEQKPELVQHTPITYTYPEDEK